MLDLTERGARMQQQAAAQVDTVRTRVGAALGEDGCRRLVRLLATVVDALPDDPARTAPDRRVSSTRSESIDVVMIHVKDLADQRRPTPTTITAPAQPCR